MRVPQCRRFELTEQDAQEGVDLDETLNAMCQIFLSKQAGVMPNSACVKRVSSTVMDLHYTIEMGKNLEDAHATIKKLDTARVGRGQKNVGQGQLAARGEKVAGNQHEPGASATKK